MNNILNFKRFLALNESAEKPSVFQKILQNLDSFGQRQKEKTGDHFSDAAAATFGRLVSKIARAGRSDLNKDFGFNWIEGDKDLTYYQRNRARLVNRWTKENLKPGRKYTEEEINKAYKDLENKAKSKYGKDFDFLNPDDSKATPEQLVWANYAASILKKYTGKRD